MLPYLPLSTRGIIFTANRDNIVGKKFEIRIFL